MRVNVNGFRSIYATTPLNADLNANVTKQAPAANPGASPEITINSQFVILKFRINKLPCLRILLDAQSPGTSRSAIPTPLPVAACRRPFIGFCGVKL
ncbi:MAG: hypothetical protein VB140_03700 [Burkholderia sp.]